MEAATDTITADELLFAADQLHGLDNAIKLEFLRTLGRIEESEAWVDDGATSFENWVAYRYSMTYAAAVAHVRTMRALRSLPRIAEAFAAGAFPWESLVELCTFVVPSEDEAWSDRASRISPAQLQLEARRARRIKREEAEEAQRERYVTMWTDDRGFGRGNWCLPPAEAAAVRKAIEREADRLARLDRPELDTFAQRAADALVELSKVRLGADADIDRATVVVHVDARDLNALNGTAMLEDGTCIPSEVARRLACDGRVETVTHDEHGNALNLGRRSRVASRAQIRALKRRDGAKCCICGNTVGLEAHHLIHWAHGGRTDLNNLVLVCWKCHCLLHDKRFRLRRDDHGQMQLIRPDGRVVRSRPVPLRPYVRERMLGPPTRVS
jgi:hypothetical protein